VTLPLRVRLTAALALGATIALLGAWPVTAAQQIITSAGPLTQIIITDDLNCQVAHRDDQEFELYSGEIGACGTLLAVGGTVFGPNDIPAASFDHTAWRPISQTPVTGSGSSGDPFRITTAVEATGTGLSVQQVDSYVAGTQSYRTDVTLTNSGGAAATGILYRAGDCYLQESDVGFGRVDGGAPACIVDPALGQRIEQWTPLTGGSRFFEGGFDEMWSIVAAQVQFPDRCECDQEQDNGAGLSWPVSVPAGQAVTFSQETFFSPQGREPVVEPFKDSIPDPTQISLDPIVIAQSIAVAAGVIFLVPFPSALFNSTLEENYDEVMGGIHRVRRWLARQFAAFRAWVGRKLAERRARQAVAQQAAAAQAAQWAQQAQQAQPLTPDTATGTVTPDTAATAATPDAATATQPPSLESAVLPPAAPAEAAPILAQPVSAELGQAGDAVTGTDVWRTPLGVLGFILLSALLYGFLDPTFGLNLGSLATFLGMSIGLFVILVAYGLPLLLFARNVRLQLIVRALPITLLVGVVCVLVSRFANFQPGYLYGLIVGFFFATAVARDQEGKAEAVAAGTSLVVALIAWVSLAFLRGGSGGEADFVTSTIQAATVTIVVAGLENAVFAMLPLRFLPGEAVFKWDRRVWFVIIGIGILGFAHVLLNPSAGYLADTTRTSFFSLVLLLVAFGLASVLFWGYFRFRPSRKQPETAI